jgi:WD40 repeat protein
MPHRRAVHRETPAAGAPRKVILRPLALRKDQLAVFTGKKQIRWNAATGEKIGEGPTTYLAYFKPFGFGRQGEKFLADSTIVSLYPGQNDGFSLRLIKLTDPEQTRSLEDAATNNSPAVSPDGSKLAFMGKAAPSAPRTEPVIVWDVPAERISRELESKAWSAYTLLWSPDSQLLACGATSGVVRVWDVATGEQRLETTLASMHRLAFSPDCRWLITARNDRRPGRPVLVWNLQTGRQEREMGEHERPLCFAVLSDNRRLVAGCLDGKIRVWDLTDGKLLKTLDGHTTGVHTLALHPQETSFVSGDSGATILHWDANCLQN